MHVVLLVEDRNMIEEEESGWVVELTERFEPLHVQRPNADHPHSIAGVNVFPASTKSIGSQTSFEPTNFVRQSTVATTAAHAILNTYPVLMDLTRWVYEADFYLPADLPAPIKGSSAGLTYALYQLEHLAGFHVVGAPPRFPAIQQRFSHTLIAATGAIDPSGQVQPVQGVVAKFRGLLDWMQQADGRMAIDELICFYPACGRESIPDDLIGEFKQLPLATRFVAVTTLADAVEAIVPDALPAPSADTSPYRGLNKFTLKNSPLFFGREDKIARALQDLKVYTATGTNQHAIIFGHSGNGKSSFVEAGLLPHWVSGLEPIVIRPADCGGDPLSFLVGLLQPYAPTDLSDLNWIQSPDQAVDTSLNSIAQVNSGKRLIIVIDQAEELGMGSISKAQAQAFSQVVSALSHWSSLHRDDGLDVWVFSSVRTSEFGGYKVLLNLPGEAGAFFPFELQKLEVRTHVESYQQIIEAPARAHGIVVEPVFTSHILSVLTELEDPLPHLQYALDEFYRYLKQAKLLNEGFTLGRYREAIGSIGKLLESRANELYKEVVVRGEERDLYALFDKLLGIDVENGTAYQTPCDVSSIKAPKHQALLNRFREYRLITDSQNRVRFTHEMLIRNWLIIKAWTGSRIKKKKRRTIRHLVLGLFLAFGLLVAATVSTITADQQKMIAESERNYSLKNESRLLASRAEKYMESGNSLAAGKLALKALPDYSKPTMQRRPFVNDAKLALLKSLNEYMIVSVIRPFPNKLFGISFSSNGEKAFLFNAGLSFHSLSLVGKKQPNQLSSFFANDDWGLEYIDSYFGHDDEDIFIVLGKGHSGSEHIVVFNSETGLWHEGFDLHFQHGFRVDRFKDFYIYPEKRRCWDFNVQSCIDNSYHIVIKEKRPSDNKRYICCHRFPMTSGTFSPDGLKILTSDERGNVVLWDTLNRKIDHLMVGSIDDRGGKTASPSDDLRATTTPIFSPNGERIVVGLSDNTIGVFNTKTGARTSTYHLYGAIAKRISISLDEERLMAETNIGVKIWRFNGDGNVYSPTKVHVEGAQKYKFVDGYRNMLSVSKNQIGFWNKYTGSYSGKIGYSQDFLGGSESVFVKDYGKEIFTATQNGIQIWRIPGSSEKLELDFLEFPVRSIELARLGSKKLVFVAVSKKLLVIDKDSKVVLAERDEFGRYTEILAVSPNGNRVVLSDENSTYMIDSLTGDTICNFSQTHKNATFSSDGNRILFDNRTSVFMPLWTVENGCQKLQDFTSLTRVYFNRQLTEAVVKDDKRGVSLYQLPSFTEPSKLEMFPSNQSSNTWAVAFSPDGNRLAVTIDHRLSIYDVESSKKLGDLDSDPDTNTGEYAFSDNGRYLLAKTYMAEGYLTMALWDSLSFKKVGEFGVYDKDEIKCFGFSKDFDFVFIFTRFQSQIWNISSLEKEYEYRNNYFDNSEYYAGCPQKVYDDESLIIDSPLENYPSVLLDYAPSTEDLVDRFKKLTAF
ncbi:WD40 repeat domain-containing protein [Glaciecola sp. 1036]|uniref:WD40 repeat domain-containing protein n=1 Tax=Alteromonadaceae TaxID=72275 RepID=UPI003CFD308E